MKRKTKKTHTRIKSHRVWNENNPHDRIEGCTNGRNTHTHVIHHKDGNHDNDAPDNQQKMTKGKHAVVHLTGNTHCSGYKQTEGHKRKISLANKGGKGFIGKHTKETKRKMSKAQKGRKHSEETKRKMSESIKKWHEKRGVDAKKKVA